MGVALAGDTTLQFKNRGGIVADIASEEFFLVIWGEKQSSAMSQHLLYSPDVPLCWQADQSPPPYSTPHPRCPRVSILPTIRLYTSLL